MNRPATVSVVVPTYYRNDLLADTLDGVQNQTHPSIEAVVIDDSGERHAEALVNEYDDINYLAFDRNRGPQAARTAGIRATSGQYVQLLDDDDILFEQKIARQVELFETNSDLVVAYSGGVYDSGERFAPRPNDRGDVLPQALTFDLSSCITSTMLIRRDPLVDLLPFPDTPGSDDTYLKIELAQIGPFDFVAEPLVLKREPENPRSVGEGAVIANRQIIEEYAQLYQKYPEEVRKQAEALCHYRQGKYYLRNSIWSPRAVRSIARALKLYPGFNVKFALMLGVSLLGNPAFKTQEKIKALARQGSIRASKEGELPISSQPLNR